MYMHIYICIIHSYILFKGALEREPRTFLGTTRLGRHDGASRRLSLCRSASETAACHDPCAENLATYYRFYMYVCIYIYAYVRVVVRVLVPKYSVPYYTKDPKRNHIFYNHPCIYIYVSVYLYYTGLTFLANCLELISRLYIYIYTVLHLVSWDLLFLV